MATSRLNSNLPHATQQRTQENVGFFGKAIRAIRDVMVSPQAAPQKVTGPDKFSLGRNNFQAASMRITSNTEGYSFQGRKVDPNARAVRDQMLCNWLENEFLKG